MIELIDPQRCTGCNICVLACPTNVFAPVPGQAPLIARQTAWPLLSRSLTRPGSGWAVTAARWVGARGGRLPPAMTRVTIC